MFLIEEVSGYESCFYYLKYDVKFFFLIDLFLVEVMVIILSLLFDFGSIDVGICLKVWTPLVEGDIVCLLIIVVVVWDNTLNL